MARSGQSRRGARSGGRRPAAGTPAPAASGAGSDAGVTTIDEAVALMERGRLLDALAAARGLAHRTPSDPNVHQLLGMIAGRRARFDEAADHHRRLVALVPADPRARCRLGMSLMYAGDLEGAAETFAEAESLHAGFPDALRGRAELLERRGDPAAALDVLAPLLADAATAAEPATCLQHVQLLAATGDHAEAARRAADAVERPGLPPVFQRKLWFARGRSLDRLGGAATDAAEAWSRANAIGAVAFDLDEHDRETEAIIAHFPASRLADAGASGSRSRATSDAPLLVVGLPRSGSTLVEQILDAHPEARGAGESRAMLDAMAGLARDHASPAAPRFPVWWDDVAEPAMTRAGLAYLEALRTADGPSAARRPRPRRVVDKNLQNLPLVGAIAEMLPHARFVVCRRDPADNGFSCWINDLSPVAFPWTGDLAAIGRVSAAWARLADHWVRVLPDRVLEVPYEAMVADAEARTRELLEFAGLPWDPAVLQFHATGRSVNTLSYDQVRRPIYRTSVRRSDRYRLFLGPMLAELQRAGLDVGTPDRGDDDAS